MLILDAEGRVINKTDKTIDTLKRESYKHSSQEVLTEEEIEGEESFVDSLEEVDETEDEGDIDMPPAEENPDAVELAILFAEFKARFIQVFGEEELTDAFLPFEEFFSAKGIDTAIDLDGLDEADEAGEEEEIPGEESSEQEIITSEIEEK
jgi:hypothetical protein